MVENNLLNLKHNTKFDKSLSKNRSRNRISSVRRNGNLAKKDKCWNIAWKGRLRGLTTYKSYHYFCNECSRMLENDWWKPDLAQFYDIFTFHFRTMSHSIKLFSLRNSGHMCNTCTYHSPLHQKIVIWFFKLSVGCWEIVNQLWLPINSSHVFWFIRNVILTVLQLNIRNELNTKNHLVHFQKVLYPNGQALPKYWIDKLY